MALGGMSDNFFILLSFQSDNYLKNTDIAV